MNPGTKNSSQKQLIENEEDSLLKRIQSATENTIARTSSMIFKKTPKSELLFKFLILINSLQHLSIAITQDLEDSSNQLVSLSLGAVRIFSMERFTRKGTPETNSLHLNFSAGALLANVVLVLIVALSGNRSKSKLKKMGKTRKCIKVCSTYLCALMLLGLRKIAFFHMVQIFGSNISCHFMSWIQRKADFCQNYDLNMRSLSTAGFGLVAVTFLYSANEVFVSDSYFESRLPFAGFTSRLWGSQMFFTTSVALLSVSFPESQARSWLIILICILRVIHLYLKISGRRTYFNESTERFEISVTILEMFWSFGLSSRSLLCFFLKLDRKREHLSLIYLFIGQLPALCCILSINSKSSEGILSKGLKSLKSAIEYEILVYKVWKMTTQLNQRKNRVMLEGFTQLHRLEFEPLSHHLHVKKTTKDNLSNKSPSPKSQHSRGNSNFQENLEQDDEDYYLGLVYHLIQLGLKNFPRSNRLKLLFCHFQHYKMGHFWAPIAQLNSLHRQSSSASLKYGAIKLHLEIERELGVRQAANKTSFDLDISLVLEYDKAYHKFLAKVINAAESNMQFWAELSTKNPRSNKLLDLGSSLLIINKGVKKAFNKLIRYEVALNPLYQIFAGFVRQVTHDQDQNLDVLEKANELKKAAFKTDIRATQEISFGSELDKTGRASFSVVQVSGNREDLGTILSVSNSIWGLLGYKPKNLGGEMINVMMPKFFSEKHNQFIENYFTTEKSRFMDSSRVVFPLHRNGFIRPCGLHLNMLCSVESGISLVGILSETWKGGFRRVIKTTRSINGVGFRRQSYGLEERCVHLIQFNYNSGSIINVSESCGEQFGLKASLFRKVSSQDVNIELILPGVTDLSNLDSLQSDQGWECVLDTKRLGEEYLYINNQEDDHQEDKNKVGSEEESERSSEVAQSRNMEQMSQSHYESSLNEGSGNSESRDGESLSLFGDLSARNYLREAQIIAWFDNINIYGGEKVVCLRFFEKDIERRESSEEESIMLELESHNQEYEDRLMGKDINQRKLEDLESSFDEIRMFKQSREELADKKNGLIYILAYYIYLICVTVGIAYAISYYYERLYIPELGNHFSSLQAMVNRGISVSKTRFLNRKMELVSSQWIPEASTNRLGFYKNTSSRLKQEYLELKKSERRSMAGLNRMRALWKSLNNSFVYPFSYTMKDGAESYLKGTYQSGVYQYMSSLSVIIHAEIDSIKRSSGAKGESTQKNPFLTKERLHFSRANHNSINSLRTGNYEMINSFSAFMDRRIFNLRWLSLLCIIFHLCWWTVALHSVYPIMYSILDNNGDILSLFGLIEPDEIEDLIDQIKTYKSAFLSDHMMIERATNKRKNYRKRNDKLSGSSEDQDKVDDFNEAEYEASRLELTRSHLSRGTGQMTLSRTASENQNRLTFKSELQISDNLRRKIEKQKSENDTWLNVGDNKDNDRFISTQNVDLDQSSKIHLLDYNKCEKRLTKAEHPQNMSKSRPKKGKGIIKRRRKKKANQNQKNMISYKKPLDESSPGKQDLKKFRSNADFPLSGSLTSRRLRLEHGDLEMKRRVERLIKTSSGRGRCVVYFIITPIFIAALSFIISLGIIKNHYAISLSAAKTSFLKIAAIPQNLNTVFNLAYENLAEAGEAWPTPEERSLFNLYVDKAYESLGRLSSRGLGVPLGMGDFEIKFKQVLFESACFYPATKILSSACSDGIGNKGLETVVIYILEGSKKHLSTLSASTDKLQTAKELLRSKEILELEELIILINNAFDATFKDFEENIQALIRFFDLAKDLVLFSIESFVLSVIYLYGLGNSWTQRGGEKIQRNDEADPYRDLYKELKGESHSTEEAGKAAGEKEEADQKSRLINSK